MRAIAKLLNTALDTILPLRGRSARTKHRALEDIPLTPESHELLGVRITTLLDYRDGAVKDLIQALKYDRSSAAASLAAALLADYLREEIASARVFSSRRILLMPVPLHISRARKRGFNQIELVLKKLPQEFLGGSVASLAIDVLERTRATRPQTRLARNGRLSNVAGAFALRGGARVSDTHIFLFDDVTTTGATLANAATPLRRTGAEVTLLALARA